ncbi:MAG: hypothetical protein GX112_10680 [Clostridiaceae bacterium]|jgi:hypothetical protein|nr:hypothetical protein [Clostridiaceae bacterium]
MADAPGKRQEEPANKTVRLIGNLLLGAALAIGLYVLLDLFWLNRAPAGTCPLDTNRPLIYLALGFSALSLLLSFFEKKRS